MENLVVIKKQNKEEVAVTTSTIIAKEFKKRHDNILKIIQKLECSEEFNRLNFKEIKYIDSRGREQKEYRITKDGFMFLVMGFTGKEASKIKEAYIKEFNKMRNFILAKQTKEWQDAREQTKKFNSSLNDSIKLLIEYAENQGSKSAYRYYIHYANLINKCLEIEKGNRGNLLPSTMTTQSFLTKFLETEIKKGISSKKYYKDIYNSCKEKVNYFIQCFNVKLEA